jgi:hypothetical protein
MKKLPPELWRRILSYLYEERTWFRKRTSLDHPNYLGKFVDEYHFNPKYTYSLYWFKILRKFEMKHVITKRELINYQTYLVVAQIFTSSRFTNRCSATPNHHDPRVNIKPRSHPRPCCNQFIIP